MKFKALVQNRKTNKSNWITVNAGNYKEARTKASYQGRVLDVREEHEDYLNREEDYIIGKRGR